MDQLLALILLIGMFISGIMWIIDKIQNNTNINLFKRNKKRNLIFRIFNSNEKIKKNIISIFPICTIVLLFRSFVYEPFQIPSGSMMPTLLIGDFILVKKFAYGIKDPFFQKTIFHTSLPKRGDVIVFKYPKNQNVNYIKRVIGIPGDKVIYNLNNKKLTIIPKKYNSIIQKIHVNQSKLINSDFVEKISISNTGNIFLNFYDKKDIKNLENYYNLKIAQEKINKKTYYILLHSIKKTSKKNKIKVWNVPQHQYFVMGDNRDYSFDSRYWGFVPEKNLVGKATYIWISFKKEENKWPTGFRLSRIGAIH